MKKKCHGDNTIKKNAENQNINIKFNFFLKPILINMFQFLNVSLLKYFMANNYFNEKILKNI